MRIPEYVATTGVTLRAISEESGVSYATIKALNAGRTMDSYSKAEAVSNATYKLSTVEGVYVRVEDLCKAL